MKKYLLMATLGATAACQTEPAPTPEADVLSQEIFTTSVGDAKVYGVQIRATAAEQSTRGFSLQFSKNEEVWIDTVYMDLAAKDTLESELIFSDAVAEEDDITDLRIETFDVE